MFNATKQGVIIRLSRELHPDIDSYFGIETPENLVLFPKGRSNSQSLALPPRNELPKRVDRNTQLRDAFDTLGSRIPKSFWSGSEKPQTELENGFKALAEQGNVRDDVGAYLNENPSVANSIEMLFTSVAMSARADWQSAPSEFRGINARGWFLGRWIPTFLILDGPILRFLKSSAFRRQEGSTEFLRAIRSFLEVKEFMALRNGFAHWSFSWDTSGMDSEIVATSQKSSDDVRFYWKEAEAFYN